MLLFYHFLWPVMATFRITMLVYQILHMTVKYILCAEKQEPCMLKAKLEESNWEESQRIHVLFERKIRVHVRCSCQLSDVH